MYEQRALRRVKRRRHSVLSNLLLCILMVFLGFIIAILIQYWIISPLQVQAKATTNQPVLKLPIVVLDYGKNEDTATPSPLIAIDPGHGGIDSGSTWEGIEEKYINLDIALKLQQSLEACGLETILTRSDDVAVELEERVAIANNTNADLFISIHQNAFEQTQVYGTETLYYPSSGQRENDLFASAIQKAATSHNPDSSRGISQREDLVVIRQTNMTACLVETGYLSNPAERAMLTDESQRQIIADNIAAGIVEYLQIETGLPIETANAEKKTKLMQFTFDDGPREETTTQILDILKERNIKATFFLVGSNVERYPEIAKRIADEGHAIGVHCYSHDYNQIYKSVDTYIADFTKARNIIQEVTGVSPTLYRFPGGSINAFNQKVYKKIISDMSGSGYIYYDWNGSLEDANGNETRETLLQSAKNTTTGRSRIVMLAHDTKLATANTLNELIDLYADDYYFDIIKTTDIPMQF